jgi:predicted transcriptional regulator of viral defense system
MPVIKYKKATEGIFGKPVFTAENLRSEGVGRSYSKKLLFMLVKSGRIKRIERGKYTCLDDPISVAPFLTQPSYLSLWTAMSIRNLTDQIPFAVEIVTSRRRFRSKVNFQGTPIIFHTLEPKMMFGYENIIWKENMRIPVALPEKIVIDAIHFGTIPEEDIMDIIKVSNCGMIEKYAALTGDEKIQNKTKEMIKCSHQKK